MISMLERAASAGPDRVAVRTNLESLSYARLLSDARLVAKALITRSADRFAVLESDIGWVLRILAGASAAGAEPCQYQAEMPAADFAKEAKQLGHSLVITRRTDLPDGLDVVPPQQLLVDLDPKGGPPFSSSQPLVIRTTGTTGRPKAALHDWARLSQTVQRVRPRPEQRWLMAYGPHQFAGIQVLQHVIAAQAMLIAPFPRQPRDGLMAMVQHEVTCVSATPTYWRFLLAEARSQRVRLPQLEQVTLGGEAVPGSLIEELRTAFPTARISQVYASTEFGSIIAVRDGRAGLDVASLYGEANPDGHLLVREGQLWVRSATGMLGYVGEPPTDAEEAEIDGWRPTGDLVEIVGDRVEFRGRSSEVINVGGVKVHPLPIEERISSVVGVAHTRVYGRPSAVAGAIVAAEIVPSLPLDEEAAKALRERVKASCGDLPPAWRPRSLKFVDAIETVGDKALRRSAE